MGTPTYLACAAALVLAGCGAALKRPVTDGSEAFVASYYIVPEGSFQPRSTSDCKKYLKRAERDSLLSSICHLNLRHLSEAASSASGVADSCYREILAYDILVEQKLTKRERFEKLQSLVSCSENEDIEEMIRIRGKLAHYETE
ncbi:MAG: hypothetical protein K0Q91_404 [Fibrobacteria bacterium]|jgi:hypothetical protein|nr:hypothetical protein [Fibrobacteria bacterium]